METDAIISVAPCRECLDMYNYLKQVSLTIKCKQQMFGIFSRHLGTSDGK